MINKIISGSQSGADIAGLIAAKIMGIETGGYAPRNFRDEFDNRPIYEKIFNLKEIDETRKVRDLRARTQRNIRISDGTILFLGKESPGSALTRETCKRVSKPLFEVALGPLLKHDDAIKKRFLIRWKDWITNSNIHVLNVAGNRETVCHGITYVVFNLMLEMLDYIKCS